MKMNQRYSVFVLLASYLLATPLTFAAEEAKPPKLFSNFDEKQVTLTGPWNTIKRNKKKDTRYPVQLSYTGADGGQHTIDAEVSLRGITRRRICDFPPLKLHFDKEKLKGTEFRGNKSLKLVTYCETNSKYEQYYIKEFLTYRIYNLITEYSFRARPMMIEYSDSEKNNKSITRFGFLIEDVDDLAKRNDLEELSIASVPYRKLDPVTTSQLSLFQYMIGNLDWAATSGPKDDSCCHNARLIGAGDDVDPKFAVPYDFDSSGLVNAHYAAPPDGLRVKNIRQRLYRGFCMNNDKLPQTIALFNEKKADILALFQNNTHLTKYMREGAIDYIEDFYEIINNPKKLNKEIIDKCRGQE
ncbi:MAG: hypothetical protein WBM36_13285 [Lysobacterales bacterium]|jgi:hypothetical protein